MSKCPTCGEVQKTFERDNEAKEYQFACPKGHVWKEDV